MTFVSAQETISPELLTKEIITADDVYVLNVLKSVDVIHGFSLCGDIGVSGLIALSLICYALSPDHLSAVSFHL